MKLNAKAEYALRVMLDLATRPGEQTTLDEIAGRQHIPATMLPNIVQMLAKAGLVETLRGYGGGVRLGLRAEDVNVRMVLESVDGPLRLYRCSAGVDPCPLGLGRDCPLRALWDKTQGGILELWGSTSLAALAKSHRKRPNGGPSRRQARRAGSRNP